MIASFAACEGADDPSEAGRATNIIANDDDGERDDDARVPAAGMYHLTDPVNVTTLELKSDGTFRWVVHGCDYGGGDIGRWVVEDGSMVLLPRTGRDQLRWPGNDGLRWPARVVLRRNVALNQLDAAPETDARDFEQSWIPGAWCAQCGGGQSGGISPYMCEDPFVDTWIDY